MKKKSWRTIRIWWFYPIIAIALFLGVLLFSLLYSGGGAKVLEEGDILGDDLAMSATLE